jgi:hypothetical protein
MNAVDVLTKIGRDGSIDTHTRMDAIQAGKRLVGSMGATDNVVNLHNEASPSSKYGPALGA